MMASLSYPSNSPAGLRRDWKALWLVRSRVIFTDIAFWLVLLGYDVRLRRFTNPIYTLYACVFFILWGFMVLLLLADLAADLLLAIPLGTPAQSALTLGTLGFFSFFLLLLHQALRRSPLVFTEEDASLLCFTPLNRRLVALEWFLEGWLVRGAVIWAAGIVLGYALLQATFPRELTPSDLPQYLLAGLRAFSISIPLSMAFMAGAWAAGVWRLSTRRPPSYLQWITPGLALIFGIVGAAGGRSNLVTALFPVSFPVQAGLGATSWIAGILVSIVLSLAGLGLLWFFSKEISLSRAAQETRDQAGIQAAALLQKPDLTADILLKQRLGTERKPTRLPARPGLTAVLWKEILQGSRRFQLGDLLPWFGIIFLNGALLAFPHWTSRLWMVGLWILIILDLSSAPLRRNLSRWALLRQLPFSSAQVLASVAALPMVFLWLAGLPGLVVAILSGWEISLITVWLFLVSVPLISLCGYLDVFRQAKVSALLVGAVPSPSFPAALSAMLITGMHAGLAWLLTVQWGYPLAFALILIILESLSLGYALWKATTALYREIH